MPPTPLIYATLALCLAIGAGIAAIALYLHVLGRQLEEASDRLHVARRGLATAPDDHARNVWRVEIGHLETEVSIIRARIRRVESFL